MTTSKDNRPGGGERAPFYPLLGETTFVHGHGSLDNLNHSVLTVDHHDSPLQVAAVREGMSSIVPVPLLSLYTAKMVETAVCGYEEVDIHMLKKVVRCVCL